MKNNGLKNAKAITLIAMVVTIIVLLILAGVSIAVLTGENGILNRATSAKQTHEEKTEEEKLKLGVLALSTEYRSQTTHTYPKFSGFVESRVADLAKELGVPSSRITINTTDDTLTYTTNYGEEKIYELDTFGGIIDYTPPAKVTVTLVKDEDNDEAISVGDEVKVGDEHFYILIKDGTTMTLLSKYNLATTVDPTTEKYYQQNANYGITAIRFSNTNYFGSEFVGGSRINLNTWETTYNKTMPEEETSSNNAILRARQYAVDVFGSNVGVKGRLLTYEEAKEGLDTCLFGIEGGKTSTTVLYGKWTDTTEKVGSDEYLNYWLASSFEYGWGYVYGVLGEGSYLNGCTHSWSERVGVRPVIEVPLSAIQ